MYRAWRKRFAPCLFWSCTSKMIVLNHSGNKVMDVQHKMKGDEGFYAISAFLKKLCRQQKSYCCASCLSLSYFNHANCTTNFANWIIYILFLLKRYH